MIIKFPVVDCYIPQHFIYFCSQAQQSCTCVNNVANLLIRSEKLSFLSRYWRPKVKFIVTHTFYYAYKLNSPHVQTFFCNPLIHLMTELIHLLYKMSRNCCGKANKQIRSMLSCSLLYGDRRHNLLLLLAPTQIKVVRKTEQSWQWRYLETYSLQCRRFSWASA